MPWVEEATKPCGLKGRESFPSQALSSRGSRDLSGRNDDADAIFPRASAFGLSPGLKSPGPLGRTHRLGSKNQAATASTGGPQPWKESTVGSSKQLGHTTTSCTISKPTPPGSSFFFRWPSFMKRWAPLRKGYSRRREYPFRRGAHRSEEHTSEL